MNIGPSNGMRINDMGAKQLGPMNESGLVAGTQHETYYDGYMDGKNETIEKACRWLSENVTAIHPRKGVKTCIVNLNVFKEAMINE